MKYREARDERTISQQRQSAGTHQEAAATISRLCVGGEG